jgi:hypothetical protein
MNKVQKNNYYINKKLQNYTFDIADSLQYEANSYMYHFGDHFKIYKSNFFIKKMKSFFFIIKKSIFFLKRLFKINHFDSKKKFILCNAYFDITNNLKSTLNVIGVPWENNKNNIYIFENELNFLINEIQEILQQRSLNKIFDQTFITLISKYKILFKNYLIKNKIKGLIFSIDLTFFESISLSCAKELEIPTFLFLHGLPARYNSIDDNRSDYLIVWGNAIKNNYITNGVSSNKIFVSGHPIYSSIKPKALKSSLENVLVLTKAMCGTPHSDMVRLMDRSNSLYYLDLIMDLLLSLGVKNARLRCHPAEDSNFYKKHLTNDFYKIDKQPLNESIKNSSLLIGPSSTMILDAINFGVNYILFEPLINGKTLTNFDLVPPFDGKHFISKTNSIESLNYNLNPDNNIDWNLVNEYISTDFSLNFLYSILNSK